MFPFFKKKPKKYTRFKTKIIIGNAGESKITDNLLGVYNYYQSNLIVDEDYIYKLELSPTTLTHDLFVLYIDTDKIPESRQKHLIFSRNNLKIGNQKHVKE